MSLKKALRRVDGIK